MILRFCVCMVAAIIALPRARADETSINEFQRVFKLRPVQKVQGEVIRTLPTYEVGTGEISYNANKQEFRFAYASKIRSHEALFELNPLKGLVVHSVIDDKKQVETFRFGSENKVFSSMLNDWAFHNWMSFVEIKSQVEGVDRVFELNFRQGFYLSALSFTVDPQNNITYARADCGKAASYLFVNNLVQARDPAGEAFLRK